MGKVMPDVSDIVAYEEGELDAEATAKMMQTMVNSGMAWQMQGSYGRAAMDAIKAGDIMLGTEGHKDYWGSYVPSRKDVRQGTKGSRQYVAQKHGEVWAKMLEGVD